MNQVHEQCEFGFRKERNRENRLKNTYSIIEEVIIISIVYESEERIWLVRWVVSGCNMVIDTIKLYRNKILGLTSLGQKNLHISISVYSVL